jgi:hypothetical protein
MEKIIEDCSSCSNQFFTDTLKIASATYARFVTTKAKFCGDFLSFIK